MKRFQFVKEVWLDDDCNFESWEDRMNHHKEWLKRYRSGQCACRESGLRVWLDSKANCDVHGK